MSHGGGLCPGASPKTLAIRNPLGDALLLHERSSFWGAQRFLQEPPLCVSQPSLLTAAVQKASRHAVAGWELELGSLIPPWRFMPVPSPAQHGRGHWLVPGSLGDCQVRAASPRAAQHMCLGFTQNFKMLGR